MELSVRIRVRKFPLSHNGSISEPAMPSYRDVILLRNLLHGSGSMIETVVDCVSNFESHDSPSGVVLGGRSPTGAGLFRAGKERPPNLVAMRVPRTVLCMLADQFETCDKLYGHRGD